MIESAIICSMVCIGAYVITDEGMIFEFLRKAIKNLCTVTTEDEMGLETERIRLIYKPLIDCLPCMASIWGVGAYFVLIGWQDTGHFIGSILGCVALNTWFARNVL